MDFKVIERGKMKEKLASEGLWERRNEREINFYRMRKRSEWSKVIRSD